MAQEKPANEEGGDAAKLAYHDLEKMTVGRLRELAQSYPDLEGVIAMTKKQLVDVLARKKGIEIPHKVVVGVDKAAVKTRMRELKKTRDAALSTKDAQQLRRTRRKLHRLRHQLRRASIVAS